MPEVLDFGYIDSECKNFLAFNSGPDVSNTHDTSHAADVAYQTDLIAQVFQYTMRERQLLRFGAWLHDLKRSPSQDPNLDDRAVSAQKAVTFLTLQDLTGNFGNTANEREAVGQAIRNHGQYPARYKDVKTRNTSPESLEDKLTEALFEGDKMTQNGAWVIARGSASIAGERLNKRGDLVEFGFRPKSPVYKGDEPIVVILERAIRLTFINPQSIHPEILRPILDPLYQVQRDFLRGLCNYQGIDVEELAEKLLYTKRVDGKNLLSARGFFTEGNKEGLMKMLVKVGGITDMGIASASNDLADSAAEAVWHFSGRYQDRLDLVARDWNPQGTAARRWKKQMMEYLDRSNGKK